MLLEMLTLLYLSLFTTGHGWYTQWLFEVLNGKGYWVHARFWLKVAGKARTNAPEGPEWENRKANFIMLVIVKRVLTFTTYILALSYNIRFDIRTHRDTSQCSGQCNEKKEMFLKYIFPHQIQALTVFSWFIPIAINALAGMNILAPPPSPWLASTDGTDHHLPLYQKRVQVRSPLEKKAQFSTSITLITHLVLITCMLWQWGFIVLKWEPWHGKHLLINED